VITGGSTIFDFSKTPTTVIAPAGFTTLDATTYTLGDQEYLPLDWTIPFTTASTLRTLDLPVNINIVASPRLSVFHIPIPEPNTLLLLGAGVAGLAATRGRRRVRG
jgi:PEP-CTERM motif-containing protein